MENKSINSDVKISDDDKALTEIMNLVKSNRHKFFYNQSDELKIGEEYRVRFDKSKLIDNIKNSKNFDNDSFSIDFFLSVGKDKYDGKMDLNFGDKLDEYNEKEFFYKRKIRFEDNCPYGAEITNFSLDYGGISGKDSYIELHVFKKDNMNLDIDPNLSYKDNIIKDIHKRIDEGRTNLMKQAILDNNLDKYKLLVKDLIDEEWAAHNIERVYNITIDTCKTNNIDSDKFIEVYNDIVKKDSK